MGLELSTNTRADSRKILGRRLRVACLVLLDIVLLQVAVIVALSARFDGSIPPEFWQSYLYLAPWYTISSIVIFAWRGLYYSLWRYAGLEEMGSVLLATTCSAAALCLISLFYHLPRLSIIIQWCVLTILVAGARLALRTLRRVILYWFHGEQSISVRGRGSRVLVVGAGHVGAELVKSLRQSGRQVVGFLDDDSGKQHMRIHGVRVLGKTTDLAAQAAHHRVDEVLLALPADSGAKRRELVAAMAGINIKFRTIPGMEDIIAGRVTVSEIRPVSIDDLLGRAAVKLNVAQIAAQVQGQVVLVTGAGGSIGSELCRQVCRWDPALLVMLGHGENSVFEATMDLNRRFPDVPKVQVIADVRDRLKIDRVFAKYHPTYVLHAAAHKHVHFMEDNPDEAVKTNIFGTQNVAQAALQFGAHKFVMISTDKAVNPTSVMGVTKRVAEMVVQDLNGRGVTKFVSVRFGNVLGSRGSVVPIFQRQIAQGGPVTVTDPQMRRYFMTIPEASQLVLQAAAIGKGGEVFVLDMGEPVYIVDLARNLITLSGYRPDIDIPIVFTGAKPGEKLFEEILLAEEGTITTEHSRIFVAKNATIASEELLSKVASLDTRAFNGGTDRLKESLLDIVPNYTPYRPAAGEEVAAASEELGSPHSPPPAGEI